MNGFFDNGTANGNARASLVNRVHRVVRAEATALRDQREHSRSLLLPLAICCSMLLLVVFSIWSVLDGYDLTPNGIPDASDQLMLFLVWFLPVTAVAIGMVWFRMGRGRSARDEEVR